MQEPNSQINAFKSIPFFLQNSIVAKRYLAAGVQSDQAGYKKPKKEGETNE
jgi:hypothetical protein